MADNQIDILIKVLADLKGGQLTREEIEKVKKASADAGKESVKATDEQTKKATGLTTALSLLGRQFGELGTIAKSALMSGPALAITALAIGIQKATSLTREWHQAILERAGEIQAIWETRRQATAEAETAAKNYKVAVDDIAKATDTLKTKEDAELKILNAILEARRKIIEAEQTIALAAAGGDKAKEAEIKARFGERFSAEEAAAEQQRIDLMRRGLAEAQKSAAAAMARAKASEQTLESPIPGLAAAAEAAVRAAARRQKEPGLIAGLSKSEFVNRGLTGKTEAEVRAMVTERATRAGISEESYMTTDFGGTIERFLAALKALEDNKAAIESADRTVREFEQTKAARKSAASADLEAWRATDRDVQQRQRQVNEAQTIQGIRRVESDAERDARFATHAADRGQGANASMIISAAAGADAVRGGGKASAEQAAAIQALTQMLSLQNQNQQTILQMFSRMNDSLARFQGALKMVADVP